MTYTPKNTVLLNLAGPAAIERVIMYVPVVISADGVIEVPAELREGPTCLKRKLKEKCNPETNIVMEKRE